MASPKRFFLIFTLTFSFLGTAVAQSISGSTSVDVDQATGMVTATCETDVGGDAQSYYEAMVKCTVADGSGAQVGYAQYIDHNGALGYAQAVVSFSGVPGTAYSAMGQHLGIATLED